MFDIQRLHFCQNYSSKKSLVRFWSPRCKNQCLPGDKSLSCDTGVEFCEQILKMHKKLSHIAAVSKFGTYPLHIDSKLALITCYFYLRVHENELFLGAITKIHNLKSRKVKIVTK